MLDHFTTPQEEGRSQYPLSPSRKDVQNESVPRHRKAASTGGGRAWTEDEVSKDVRLISQDTDKVKGVVPSANPQQQNALQTYCGASSKDRARLSTPLPSDDVW
jgi:hypothetical protein